MFVQTRIRLANDPRSIQTKTGTPMATGFGFADIGGENGMPLGLVAFNDLAAELLKYSKGATLGITGQLRANDYTNRDGEEVKGYQVIIDGLIGVKRASPIQVERLPKKRKEVTEHFYEDAVDF